MKHIKRARSYSIAGSIGLSVMASLAGCGDQGQPPQSGQGTDSLQGQQEGQSFFIVIEGYRDAFVPRTADTGIVVVVAVKSKRPHVLVLTAGFVGDVHYPAFNPLIFCNCSGVTSKRIGATIFQPGLSVSVNHRSVLGEANVQTL